MLEQILALGQNGHCTPCRSCALTRNCKQKIVSVISGTSSRPDTMETSSPTGVMVLLLLVL